jgi:O-antigen biosynthesis protein WbqV
VRDAIAINHLFWDEKPDIVFHAAAMKHVPLLETPHNLVEAVLTNVMGTKNIVDACGACNAEMILISTDKAVNPSSVMGHTKRLAELYTEGRCTLGHGRKFAQVRFGNVIGSSGSVVPLFRRQIAQGGPVTITHPEMTRYMLSIKEAVSLVLSASVMNHANGSNYGLYILDMGDPVKILDIAHQLISLAGLTPGRDIMIEVIGMRPGEKLHEELSYPWEDLARSPNPRVFKAHPTTRLIPKFVSEIAELSRLFHDRDASWARMKMEAIMQLDHKFHLKSDA